MHEGAGLKPGARHLQAERPYAEDRGRRRSVYVHVSTHKRTAGLQIEPMRDFELVRSDLRKLQAGEEFVQLESGKVGKDLCQIELLQVGCQELVEQFGAREGNAH